VAREFMLAFNLDGRPPAMAFDAFISYSSKDKTAADAACAVLESAGIRCWIAPRDIRAGEQYGAAIVEAIEHCRLMVLVFSSSANDSTQIQREIERAVAKGVPILPVRIEEVTPTKSMEYFLGAIHWLDALSPPFEKHLAHLAETVKAMLKIDGDIHGRSASDVARRIFVPKPIGDSELAKQCADDAKQPTATARAARPSGLLLAIGGAALLALVAGGVWLYRPNPPAPAASAPAVPAPAAPAAAASCAQERGAKSAASTTPATIIFNNKTAALIKIFWLNFQGERKLYGEMPAGASGRQGTYVDHLWVVTNAQGDCLGFYRAEVASPEFTIGP
jgi:hypothetical protein